MILGLAGGCAGHDPAVVNAPAPPPLQPNARSDCDRAAYEIEGVLQGTPAVTGVAVPTCAKAIVSTSLGADGVGRATAVCRTATTRTVENNVVAVSVVSADGTELATGTSTATCGPPKSARARPAAPARPR